VVESKDDVEELEEGVVSVLEEVVDSIEELESVGESVEELE